MYTIDKNFLWPCVPQRESSCYFQIIDFCTSTGPYHTNEMEQVYPWNIAVQDPPITVDQ